MQQEATPIIRALAMRSMKDPFGKVLRIKGFEKKIQNTRLIFIVQGIDPRFGVETVGTEAATLATQLAIQTFNPNLILNAGTAGAFASRGAKIADVYLSKGTCSFHGRRIPIPGYQEYGVGSYPLLNVSKLASRLGLKQGIISTGSSLDMTPSDKTQIEGSGATLKDMEAAAIAYVADLHRIPMFAVKAVTDLLDSKTPTSEAFLKNFKRATEALQKHLISVLHVCATSPLSAFSRRT